LNSPAKRAHSEFPCFVSSSSRLPRSHQAFFLPTWRKQRDTRWYTAVYEGREYNANMDSFPNSEIRTPSPDFRTPSILTDARRASNASIRESSAHANAHSNPRPSMSPHQSITLTEPVRPAFPARLRASARGESHRSMSEAMRIARSREEQEELLDDEEQADDDGCYPPRKNDDPRAPNPHGWLPVYTTIHKIRRLVVASIGRSFHFFPFFLSIALWSCALHDVWREQSLRFFNRTARASR
jgi:hypothetical protein